MLKPLQVNNNYYSNYYLPSFKSNDTNNQYNNQQINTIPKLSQNEEIEKPKMSTTKKFGLGVVLATGLLVVGDYIFAKGKHVKSIIKGLKSESKTGDNLADVTNKSKIKTEPKVEPQPVNTPKSTVEPPKTHKKPEVNSTENIATTPKQKNKKQNDGIKPATQKGTTGENKPQIEEPKTNNSSNPQNGVTKNNDNSIQPKTQEQPKGTNSTQDSKKAGEITQKEAERRAKKQAAFEKEQAFAKSYVKENMEELDKVLLNNENKIQKNWLANSESFALEDLIKPYNGKVEYFYHATTPEAKAQILKEGFNPNIAPKHGFLDGVGGTYFSIAPDANYGGATIKAKFKGKIAEVDTNLLDDIKAGNNMKIFKYLENKGYTFEEASEYHEAIIREYLQQKIFQMGYQGIIGKGHSYTAGCKYFSALNPKLIEIIE